MSLRVLLVTGSYPPMKCGIGDYSYKLAAALSASGSDVGVLTSISDKSIAEAKGVKVFPVIQKWGFTELIKVLRIIRSWKPDIVHIQYPTQGYGNGLLPWILPLVSFLMKKKIVQTWHEAYGRRKAPKLLIKSIVPTSLVFVRSQYRDCLHPSLRWALWNKRIEYIPSASCIPGVQLNEQQKAELRKKYLKNQKRLIVFFGFIYPHKGVELLFEIADPNQDQILITGVIDPKEQNYLKDIKHRASVPPWEGKVTITDFIPANDVAAILSVADAVVLPFRVGGGDWNTSIHAAVLNGAFVITTSLSKSGYEKRRNIYFAKIDAVDEMRQALSSFAGVRREHDPGIDRDEWLQVADKHRLLYEKILF